ncbi:beta-L-arabinofuranosidase domain-containing protein [Pacificimonas flava]|uniref:beta-L-arabinofuranosidase domain-containing protein n=1 Tax=Pacificimonas flava TaxID=1234595 RepID=UPI0030845C1C
MLAPTPVWAGARGQDTGTDGLLPSHPEPLPLSDVRLLPSPWADAVERNREYLMSLDPDRLLHNYRTSAGLAPKGDVYGGWESDTIAGHTLGHYLSALALTHAQTGDEESCRRANYIVGELATVQAAHGDGYVAGFTRKRPDGEIVDGKEIFPEIMAGDIRSAGFDLNGCWVPLYNWHKLYTGLYDVADLCGNRTALPIAVALGDYIDRMFAALDDEQVQTVLACEYGGLNESFAELYARTGERRWLRLGERIYDNKVLDPLTRGEDRLANFHANTQVPKLIGLARLYELTSKPAQGAAAEFFWDTVTKRHSYVIGGNADREYFSEPNSISKHITEQTCEHCNSYNMLKLTRHLYSWRPRSALFDFYERAHLNHILSQQHPETGGFSYMTPLMSGTAREYSEPGKDAFWCCVGTGMESHAKHGDSIFWQGDDALIVNLYIPAAANWRPRGASVRLETRYPEEGSANLTFTELAKPGRFPVALRVPAWAESVDVRVNGKAVAAKVEDGYVTVSRRWQAGDRLAIAMPMRLRIEPTADDPDMIALLRGPMVLAADLGPAEEEFDGAAPALVGSDLLAKFVPEAGSATAFATQGIGRPGDMRFVPFYSQYDRRSAVYFRRFTDAQWQQEKASYAAAAARQADLAARSVDIMHLGEMQPERNHDLEADISYPVTYRGRNGRDARTGGFFEFDMSVRPGPLVLQATYWGDERPREFYILIDGERIAAQRLAHDEPGEFIEREYAVPETLTKGKTKVRVRVEPKTGDTAGPVFGMRLMSAKGPTRI